MATMAKERRGPVALFLSNAPLAPYFSIWQRGRLRVKYRDRCLVINMLFLARGISLSFLLPAPLEATASLPNLASCPEFWERTIYRARITTCISCNPSFFACNSLTLFAWLRTRDFLFSTSKFDGRRFQMRCGESECSSPPLWREESININFRIGIGAAVPPPLLLRFCFSYPQCRPPSSRRFEFRTFSRSRPP